MAALFRFGVMFLTVIGVGLMFVNEVARLGGSKNRLKSHLAKLRSSLASYLGVLVPMDHEELTLLSMNKIKKKAKKSSLKIRVGQVLSIYDEPSLAYSWVKYSKSNSLLMIASKENEFYYLVKSNQVKLFVNNQPLGVLLSSGEVRDGKEANQLLASLDTRKELKFQEIKSAEGVVWASLNNPRLDHRANQRVFHLLEKSESNQNLLIQSLAYYNLMQGSNIG